MDTTRKSLQEDESSEEDFFASLDDENEGEPILKLHVFEQQLG